MRFGEDGKDNEIGMMSSPYISGSFQVSDSETTLRPTESQEKMTADYTSSSSSFNPNMNLQDHMRHINLRAQRTIGCYLTYVIMIWLAIVVILWEISSMHRRPNHWLHIAIESVISIFLIAEIFVFTVAMGRHYFAQWIHVADLVITIGCALIFVGLLVDEMVESFDWPDEVELSILLVRYGLMACRLLCLCYRSGRAGSIRQTSAVRFSRVASDNKDAGSSQGSKQNIEGSPGWMVSMEHPKARQSHYWRPLKKNA
mmetsp:Transcript_14773/g.29944  ORF Transcript_14773/g.29944 Transcript_14773/m.29944 type:complete len:257 (+) Transcript_14773:57-827(+)